jgi:hypothetical protein
MHRNVIFRDDANRARQVEPFTFMAPGSPNPVDLWKWMEAYEKKTGGSVLAIPHNGNLSNGIMFPVERAYTGKAVDKAYVEQRAKWERLYEVTQTKGDGETHPFLSPNDEFADFETKFVHLLGSGGILSKIDHSYVRQALKSYHSDGWLTVKQAAVLADMSVRSFQRRLADDDRSFSERADGVSARIAAKTTKRKECRR